MDFRVLGPVALHRDGERVDLGPMKQRTVLAALLVDVGRPVPPAVLIERVWDGHPPARVRNVLQTYVARLRHVLRDVGQTRSAAVLRREPGGYLLDVGPDRVDVHQFRSLVARARSRDVPQHERLLVLREAVELWRGEPLADVPGDWAARVREAWRPELLEAVVPWAYAEMSVGNANAVVPVLSPLCDLHPMAEGLIAALMQALHATGRGGEALEHYERSRQLLADELGVDPGLELRQVYQGILRGDLQLPVDVHDCSAGHPIPAQLPITPTGFVGRGGELATLDGLLAATDRQPAAVVISALTGAAGVGKTTLALHWATRVTGRFPDGQLYVNLRGFGPAEPATDPSEALRGFLTALGTQPDHIPSQVQDQAALYRSLLAQRRVLVVLDNARDAAQVRPLLPGAPRCFAVVTSRDALAGLVVAEGARALPLDVLPASEARQMLIDRVGALRALAEPDALDEILARCAGLPLALAIAGAHLAVRPDVSLATLAAELRDTRDSLVVFAGDDPVTDVRTVFSWSCRPLDPATARLFRLLGLHPGPDFTAAVAASLAGVSLTTAQASIGHLLDAHLIMEYRPGRYTIHELLHVYAEELTAAEDTDQDRHNARQRLLDHCLHSAVAATELLGPHREPIELLTSQTGVTAETFRDRESAAAWLAAEQAVLVIAVHYAASTGFDTHAWQLSWALAAFLNLSGHWSDWLGTQETALQAARRRGDHAGQAFNRRMLARCCVQLGRYEDAEMHYKQAIELFDELNDAAGKAHVYLSLAWMMSTQQRDAEALRYDQMGLELYRMAHHRLGEGRALNMIAWDHARLGDHENARTHAERSLTVMSEVDDRYGSAAAWDTLGYVHHHTGDHAEALNCYHRALERYREANDRSNQAEILTHIGDTHKAADERDHARTAWEEALSILDELAHPDAAQVRERLRNLNHVKGGGERA